VIAAVGSATGFWFGGIASQLAAARAHLPFVFERPAAVVALGTALLLNLVFAAWPASRAARLDPIQALKHE